MQKDSSEIYSVLYDMSMIETIEIRLCNELIVDYGRGVILFCSREDQAVRAVHGTF